MCVSVGAVRGGRRRVAPGAMPRGRPPKPRESKARGHIGSWSTVNFTLDGCILYLDGVLTLNAESTNYAYQVPNFHKCEICLLSFPKESQFQRHMRDHERNDKPHRCDQCPQTFNVEFNLTLHKCTHNGEDPTCPVCNKKFSRVASLKAHIMLHEKEEGREVPCAGHLEDCGAFTLAGGGSLLLAGTSFL